MKQYLAVDPGTKRTGFALFDEKGNVTKFFKTTKGIDEALDYLESVEGVTDMIVETYRNRGNQHDSWSTMPTAQLIGAIKRIARKKGWTIHEQEPSCLAIGLRHIGLATTYQGKHVPDEVSALAHGEYWLRKNKVK